MVLPLPIPASFPDNKLVEIRALMETKLLDEWDCFAAVFVHDGKWWTRCSAQVWSQVSIHQFDVVKSSEAPHSSCRISTMSPRH